MEYSRTIKSSGNALLSVINDILDFSKIESGELDFEEIDFDPEILAYDVCEVIRPRVGSKPIEIICHIGDDLPAYVKGDPGRFRQVLTNLMGNASKFTEAGEIELSLDVETANTGSVKLHARVRDTGIGLPKDKLETIFKPFKQADGSTTRRYGGTGLGLSICKKISNLMDGDVWAESEVGKGSLFHFTARLKKTGEKEAKRFVPVSLSGKRALIVDDNQINLNLLTHLLQSIGMEVVALRNGLEAKSTFQNAQMSGTPFNFCIVDIHMPDMSGYDVAREIRKGEDSQYRIALIALSSVMQREAKKCKEAGFDGFLSKPIRKEKLYQMIERLLEKKKGDVKGEKSVREKIMKQHSVREDIKHSVRILLAEDNPVNQKLAILMLSKAGYQVEVADNGREAVDKYTAAASDFDLIFMDVQMPETDGLEATKKIRAFELEGSIGRSSSAIQIPIIARTAHAMKGDMEMCLGAGMDDFITKPISHPELISRLNSGIRILELERSLKKANEEIRVLSITDSLTGCFNRGYMNEHLLKEIMRSKRYNHPLSVVLCDIDHFKQVNDTYGHPIGDRVLIAFAQLIRETIREKIDWVVRYWGEEFLVVLPETEFNRGCLTAERLRQAVSQMEIEEQNKTIKVTASFGATGFDADTDDGIISPDAIINRTDEHLYKAKKEGRNRVCARPL